MFKWCYIFPWSIAWKVFDRAVAVVVWLFVACVAISLVADVVGRNTFRGTFGFGDLWIQYEIRTGGLLPDRLDYVLVRHDLPELPEINETADMDRFFLTGQSLAAVQPSQGQTVWIDEQGCVTRLGSALRLSDIKVLQNFGLAQDVNRTEMPTLSSPDEFLAVVARLRAGSTRQEN